MPTVTIATQPLPDSRRRAIALRITRWFADRGVVPRHVIVRFDPIDTGQVYAGGGPIDALPAPDGDLRHASVLCCVGPHRDDEFRAALAEHIVDTLGVTAHTPFFYLEFRTTPLSDVYLATAGPLHRSDRSASSTEDLSTGDLSTEDSSTEDGAATPTRIRAAIAARLGDGLALVGDDEDLREALGDGYDSLTAMECIMAVEQEFGVEVDFVADDVRYWFATITRMSQFVSDRVEDAAVLGGVR
jgi:acyl carrier protein